MEKRTLEVEEILQAIKKRKKIIFLIVTLFLVLAGVYGFVLKKEVHVATVKIFSGKTETAGSYSKDELADNSILMDTYIELIKTDNFMNSVIAKSGINISADSLKKTVGFSKTGSTPILTISYTSGNKETAKKVVSVIATEFEKEVKETILNINTKVIEDVKVITHYPNEVKYLILGFIAGLIIAIGIVLVLDCLDNSLQSKTQLEKLLPIPVLGELPLEKSMLKDK
jgi:capsular polysaccharide biosynthesis protein